MIAVELRVIVTTEDEGAADRIESTVRRALGQWIDPQRIYVEQAIKP